MLSRAGSASVAAAGALEERLSYPGVGAGGWWCHGCYGVCDTVRCTRVCVGLSSYDSVCAPLAGSLCVTGCVRVCVSLMYVCASLTYALVYRLCACLTVSPLWCPCVFVAGCVLAVIQLCPRVLQILDCPRVSVGFVVTETI